MFQRNPITIKLLIHLRTILIIFNILIYSKRYLCKFFKLKLKYILNNKFINKFTKFIYIYCHYSTFIIIAYTTFLSIYE